MQIIINADDFGISEELNLCVEKLHKLKLITSASLISKGIGFDHAVKISKRLPELGIGVHLTLDGPFNVLMNSSSVLDPVNNQFYDADTAVKKIRYGRYKSEDIYREYCAQIENIYDHGIHITHIDHHHHYHLYYKSLKQVIRVAHKYKIKCVRSQILVQPSRKSMINCLYRRFHQVFIKKGSLITTDGYFELVSIKENSYLHNIERIKLLLASGLASVDVETHPRDEQNYDTKFLQHPDFIELIRGHQLINYKDLLKN